MRNWMNWCVVKLLVRVEKCGHERSDEVSW